MKLGFRTGTTSPIALQHCIAELDGAHWCVACVNSVKDHLKQACYGRAWRSQQQVLPLSHSYNGITPSLRTPLRGGEGEERSDAGTVHSKCSSTGSACPVAIGHRDSIQQEMLKRYLSDLLGEPCLIVSVVPLPGFALALRPWVRGMVSIVPGPPTLCPEAQHCGTWG